MKRCSLVAGVGLLWLLVGGAALPVRGASAPPSAPASTRLRVDGLWEGTIVYQPGQVELDVTVEVSGEPLVGTIDVPAQDLRFHPLRAVQVDGSKVAFGYDLVPGKDDPANRFWLRGELAPDGKAIAGEFTGRIHETDLRIPFRLERRGDAGSDRPAAVKPPLVPLSDRGDELRAAFNRDRDKLRLVMLLSPTCPACLGKAGVTKRYVLDRVKDDGLRVYVVWGPMLGDEKEENARDATALLPDPRVTHFWTATNTVAERFGRAVKLPDGLLGWDTYQLFAPGATWGDAPPAPARFMQMNKPLPDDLLFNGEKLATWVREALPASPRRP